MINIDMAGKLDTGQWSRSRSRDVTVTCEPTAVNLALSRLLALVG